jgi:hypothetical protein
MPEPIILALTLFYLWNIVLSVGIVVVVLHGFVNDRY